MTGGAFQTAKRNRIDAFVKINAEGSWTPTYLGGDDDDEGRAIAVDASGKAYITGGSGIAAAFPMPSLNFPTTVGAFQPVGRAGNCLAPGAVFRTPDAFVTKLNSSGSALVYSSYLGGNDHDFANGIAVDSAGNAYVTGDTRSTDFPTTPGSFQPATVEGLLALHRCLSSDAFVAKVNSSGSALVYSTYLGGRAAIEAMASPSMATAMPT